MSPFIGEQIQIRFDVQPFRQKTPSCPDGFTWQERDFRVTEKISEWTDFTRRGRMARNMSSEHAEVAAGRGSLGVGRFFFRVKVDGNRFFDLYYDRAVKNVDDRTGHWYLYREVSPDELNTK